MNGELDNREMHKIERRAQADPMLMDLIEGMALSVDDEHDQALIDLDARIKERIAPYRKKIIPLLLRWSVAASVVFALSIAGYYFMSKRPQGYVAQKQKVPIQLSPAKPDTHNAAIDTNDNTLANVPADNIPPTRLRKPAIKKLGTNSRIKDSLMLDEVVVTGYAAQRKTMVVGASATVKVDTNSAETALAGKVAGLSVQKGKYKGPVTVSGIVRDRDDSAALEGVKIAIKDSATYTTTDGYGEFTITVPHPGTALTFSYPGYKKQSAKVKKPDSLFINLKPERKALNEIASKQTPDTTQHTAHPVSGWAEYNTYLEQKATASGRSGTVILSFYVSESGELSNFSILKSDDAGLNNKAIEIIKNGPAWVGPDDASQKVRIKIKFKK